MATRLKQGRLVQTRDRRRAPALAPSSALSSPRPPDAPAVAADPALLRALRRKAQVEGLMLGLVAEAKQLEIKVFTANEVRAAEKRRHRVQSALAKTPEGRAVLSSIAERRSSPVVRGTLREFARVLRDGVADEPKALVALLYDAVDIAEQAISDYDITCQTAKDWAISYGIWFARQTQASGRAAALRFDVRSITVTEKETKPEAKVDAKEKPTAKAKPVTKSTTYAASLYKDTNGIAATAASRVEYALRTMREAEGWWREVEKRRSIEASQHAWRAKAEQQRPALQVHEDEDDEDVVDAPVTAVDEDVAEAQQVPFSLGVEEHGAPPELSRHGSGGADDLQEDCDAPSSPLVGAVWCSTRKRLVPASLAGVPLPRSADGPDWVQEQARQERLIRAFDEALNPPRDL